MSIELLGKGISVDFGLDSMGEIKMSSYEKSVEESIYIILSTHIGERVYNSDFGCRIHELMFEANNVRTQTMAKRYVEEALNKYEPRINILNTEVFSLDEKSINELIDAGLDSIKFSFQGVDQKSYAEMRNTDYYDKLIEVIALFHKIRGERSRPYIHVSTTITYESMETVEKFKEELKDITDLVSVGRTILEHIDVNEVKLKRQSVELLKKLKKEETVVKKHMECTEVFDKLSINWDGTVSACCWDSDNKMTIGNVDSENSFMELWNCKKLNKYRKILSVMGHNKLELCKSCYDYQGLITPGLQET